MTAGQIDRPGRGSQCGDFREIEGFGALAQNRGAGAVLATLWSVEDISTARLMTLFYGIWSSTDLSKAEALRVAQVAFIEKRTTRASQNLETQVSELIQSEYEDIENHPFFWAPFILIGDWT